jgi:hypothetical protein
MSSKVMAKTKRPSIPAAVKGSKDKMRSERMPGERAGHMPGERTARLGSMPGESLRSVGEGRQWPGVSSPAPRERGSSSGVVLRMPGEGRLDAGMEAVGSPRDAGGGHVLVLDNQRAPAHARVDRLVGIEQGSTAHFVVGYDPALGANGPTLAAAVLDTCEQDYAKLQGYFGGITPSGLPFRINIVPGSGGAGHGSCLDTNISCDAFSGTNADLVRMLVVAEADEVFMAAQNAGWDCAASNGEALSRVLATQAYPAELNGFATAAAWLNSNRPDWVTNNDPTAGTGGGFNPLSIGCSVLFINYLRYQLHFTLAEIVQAGGTTLQHTYENLTGSTDAFNPFAALLQRHFPVGTPVNLPDDNVFPLLDAASWGGWETLDGLLTSPFSVTAWAPDRLDIFALGGDNAVWHKWWDGNAWGGWESLFGLLTSPPASVAWGPNRLDIFALGGDNAVWHKWWDGNAWGGWETLDGLLTSPPSVVSWGPNRLDIFALGGDNAVWHKWWDGNAWGGWESLGGLLTSPPASVAWGPNRLDIFALGGDNAVWHEWWDGNAWGGWESLGAPPGSFFTSPPDAVSWDENRLDIFALGADNAVWHKWWDGNAWSGWESLGGLLTSPPNAVAWSANRLDIFARGGDNAIWHKWWDGDAWGGWESLGDLRMTSPPASAAWAANRLDIFARGGDNAMRHKWWG